MEITKLSTKGQVVIPDTVRKDLKVGTGFVVTRRDDMIILKRIVGLTEEEEKEMKELDKIWKDIDKGNCGTYEVEEFFAKMKEW